MARAHTLQQAAAELGLPITTLRNWRNRDDFPGDRRPAPLPVLVDVGELRAWAAERGLPGHGGKPVGSSSEARRQAVQAMETRLSAAISAAEHRHGHGLALILRRVVGEAMDNATQDLEVPREPA